MPSARLQAQFSASTSSLVRFLVRGSEFAKILTRRVVVTTRCAYLQENNTERTTSLNVYLPSSIQFIAALHTLTGLLHGAAGAAVTELEIIGVSDAADWLDHTTQDNIMLFMRQCGFAFPALTKLTIHDCPVALPPAEQLPCVRDLDLQGLNMDLVMNLEEMEGLEETMNEHDEALCRILAGYLPGLATLSLKKCVGARGEHLSLVFTPASSRQALTSFSTDAPLTGELTRLLVAHAPELKQLSVGWLLHHHVDDDQGKSWLYELTHTHTHTHSPMPCLCESARTHTHTHTLTHTQSYATQSTI